MAARPHEILQESAALLKSQSAGMSLRAVAKRLGLSAGYWSKVLKGTKPLPLSLFPAVVKTLGLDVHAQAQLQRSLLSSIEADHLTSATGLRTENSRPESPLVDFRNFGGEDLWLLEEWYYLPILNLFAVEGFAKTPEELKKRMGITAAQASRALHRMQESGLVRECAGAWERTETAARFPTSKSLAVVRKFHHEMLGKAREELSRPESPEVFAGRLISGISFSGSSEKVKEASLIIEEALYRAANLMADAPKADKVYQLNVQLFPITK